MQRMPVIVSPELRNAEARWLEKVIPHNFSLLTALEFETTVQSCHELQTAAGQSARVKIIQLNKYPFAVLFAKCSSWGKNRQTVG
jgi:hypothetical protein